jgi:hypothetical protein
MSYKKYVELLDLNNITSEPTENPTTVLYTFSPTMYPQKSYNNTDLIIVAVCSSFSGMLFIILIIWCKYKYTKKIRLEINNGNKKNNDNETFGMENILDDV